MTVREMVEKLSALPQDINIYTAKDAEGNGFNDPWSIQLENVIETEDYEVLNIIADEDLPDYDEEGVTQAVVIW